MSKQSKVCIACNQDNLSDADFCTNCGATFSSTSKSSSDVNVSSSDIGDEDSYKNWVMSIPYILAACILILFIDLMTGNGINWSYWVIVPVFLFAIIAPYFSFKLENTV